MKNELVFHDNGSNWHKWDLHCHTASSYDYKYKTDDANELLVNEWIKQNINAVVITDHFRIDSKRIEELRRIINEKELNITLFPGVELRTDKGATNIHVILMFDNNYDIKTLEEDFNVTMLRGKAKPIIYTNENIYWDYNDIVEFAKEHKAIISIHTGKKANGMDEEISNSQQIGMAIKTEYAESVDIFEVSKLKDIEGYKKHVFNDIKARPLVICSDNHDPRNYVIKENLWIKAKLNFEGLKQAVIHCDERVYVGDSPNKITSVYENPERYIDEISVTKRSDAKNYDNWFNFTLKLNPGLTTIIGNKGSGKSALADFIGYVGGTDNYASFSFLSKDRFCKEDKRFNLDYTGKLSWLDNEEIKVENFDVTSDDGIRYVRYLPQKYIEDTCNNLDKRFQREIDKVIYSYIDEKDRENSSNLLELIESKESFLEDDIYLLKSKINETNKSIIKLEYKKQVKYIDDITKKLKFYEKELERHDANKPKKVSKPVSGDTFQEQGLNAITNFTNKITELNQLIKNRQEELIQKRGLVNRINQFIMNVNECEKNYLNLKDECDYLNELLHLEPNIKIKFDYDVDSLKSFLSKLACEISVLEKELDENFTEIQYSVQTEVSVFRQDYEHMISLYGKIYILNERIKRAKEKLSKPQKDYQTYVENLGKWENKRTLIIGNATSIDSLTYYKNELDYLKNKIDEDLLVLRKERVSLIEQVFECITSKKKILDEIYQPIEKKLDKVLQNIDDKVIFKSTTSIDENFVDNLLSQINQVIQSKYKGKVSGNEYVNSLIRKYRFDDKKQTLSFVNEILDSVNENDDKYDTLLKDRLNFYNYVSSLSYLNVSFSLKMGEKDLSQLSPGEKGTVLLIFYLALDKENLPLIIDQPEDNLDNQSVFKKLVPCVIEAKKNRQVILITHNPNLALACDSDLVIYCEKDQKANEIRYVSGAIEDNYIREKMIDILEGTMPAFDLRADKYKEQFLRKW